MFFCSTFPKIYSRPSEQLPGCVQRLTLDQLVIVGWRMSQLSVALVFGGRSAEHAVSIKTASTIHKALAALGHEVHCVGIDKEGNWRYHSAFSSFPDCVDTGAPYVTIQPGKRKLFVHVRGRPPSELTIDLLYPALHGRWGEDGTIQGLAQMCALPCVGAGVLGSAVSMDKDFAKRLLKANGISVVPWLVLRTLRSWGHIVEALGNDSLFLKPASSGSSVGVFRVRSAAEYAHAFAVAVQLDAKVLLEPEVRGREIECGVLEVDGELVVSELGEVMPVAGHDFYSYQAKYEAQCGENLRVPCDLPLNVKTEIQKISKAAFRCLGLDGFARVDFFYTSEGAVIINEVNTLPGFTDSSMYPKVFECVGYTPEKIIAALLSSAMKKSRA